MDWYSRRNVMCLFFERKRNKISFLFHSTSSYQCTHILPGFFAYRLQQSPRYDAFDKKDRKIFRTPFDSLHNNLSVTSFLKINDDELWIGSYDKGLFRYKEQTPTYPIPNIQDLCLVADTLIMIATENNGLFEYNKQNGNILSINTAQKETNLNSNAVTCLYKDLTHIIWVGTTNGGVNKFDPNQEIISNIYPSTQKSYQGKAFIPVLALDALDEENLLIGLDNKGLYTYNKSTGKILPHKSCKDFPELKDIPINAVLYDSRGFTWIGTYRKSMKVVGPQPEQNILIN